MDGKRQPPPFSIGATRKDSEYNKDQTVAIVKKDFTKCLAISLGLVVVRALLASIIVVRGNSRIRVVRTVVILIRVRILLLNVSVVDVAADRGFLPVVVLGSIDDVVTCCQLQGRRGLVDIGRGDLLLADRRRR